MFLRFKTMQGFKKMGFTHLIYYPNFSSKDSITSFLSLSSSSLVVI